MTGMGTRGIGMGEILVMNRETPSPGPSPQGGGEGWSRGRSVGGGSPIFERRGLSMPQHPHPGPPLKGEGVDRGSRSFGMISLQRQEQNNVR